MGLATLNLGVQTLHLALGKVSFFLFVVGPIAVFCVCDVDQLFKAISVLGTGRLHLVEIHGCCFRNSFTLCICVGLRYCDGFINVKLLFTGLYRGGCVCWIGHW